MGMSAGPAAKSSAGSKLLELKHQGDPTLTERVAECTSEQINSAPRPMQKPSGTDGPKASDLISEMWASITSRINVKRISDGFLTLSPKQKLAAAQAADEAITAELQNVKKPRE